MPAATVLTVGLAPEAELISAAEAKRHLRILSPDIEDGEVLDKVAAAREWVEKHVSRTLRAATTLVQSYNGWPASPIRLEYPPLLGVTSIDYYDIDDVDQELTASNYRIHTPTEMAGYIKWTDAAVLPSHATRDDAIRITYTAGYASGIIPAAAKQAILLRTTIEWGDATGRELEATERALASLVNAFDLGTYR